MLNWIRTHKKLTAMLVGIFVTPLIAALNARFETELDPVQVIAVIVAYIVGQGIADNGKEAVKAAVKPPRATHAKHDVLAGVVALMLCVGLAFGACAPPAPNDCQPGYVKDAAGDCIVDPSATYDAEGNLLDPSSTERADIPVPKQVWFADPCFGPTSQNPTDRLDVVLTIGPANKSRVAVEPNLITHQHDLQLRSCVLYSWCVE